jgi:hypothetical protein
MSSASTATSNRSATNPYATDTPRLYDQEDAYRGKLRTNPYDPDSVSNLYGRYGNPSFTDSLNNRFGAGNPYKSDSPTNPYGRGWRIEGKSGYVHTGIFDATRRKDIVWQ